MHIKNKKGQSTVEYVLLATAVIAVIIVMVATPGSLFRSGFSNALKSGIEQVGTESDRLANSEPGSNGHLPAPSYGVNVTP